MSTPGSSRWDYEVRLLALLAVCVSVFSFLFYFRRGEVMLYGDAVAHINIARRVFDSSTPGLLQLGTVWLPLPHLLMIPFLISDRLWRSGVGGSIPSMAAYVFGVIGMFRLVRGALARKAEPGVAARAAAWAAAAIYGANPNLIYMQTTAMGEALYLAFFIWAVVYFSEFARGEEKAPTKCGLCLTAACLTRYDAWFLAAALVVGVVAVTKAPLLAKDARNGAPWFSEPAWRKTLIKFVLFAAAAPALWLGYNAVVYHNPLEFENGPYSAKAIEKRTETSGSPGHPGSGNPVVGGLYFLKSAEANLAENEWLQRLWIVLAIACVLALAVGNPHLRKEREDGAPRFVPSLPLVFLLVPLPFYALSVAYGGVPIFIPAWWPFTHYNVRYGLQLLPLFATAAAFLVYVALRSDDWPAWLRRASVTVVIAVAGISYVSIWVAQPICYTEAAVNMRTRNALEKQLAGWLSSLPPNCTLLMYLGEHPGAVQQAVIPLKRVINEGNHRVWKRPVDPEGLWERALANPSELADYVVAFEGDAVWQAVHTRHLPELVEINVTGQRRAIVYRAR